MNRPDDAAWPLPPVPEDPWGGEGLLEDPGSAFGALARLALLGRIAMDDPRLAALAARAGLDTPPLPIGPLPPGPPPATAPVPPCDAWFAEIAEDVLPDVGLLAPDRVLGPRADAPPTCRERILAAGVLALAPFDTPRVRPLDRWLREPVPAEVRAAVRAVDRAPPCAWRIEATDCTPLLPMDPSRVPSGPVSRAPSFEGDPVVPLASGTWIARCVPGPTGGWLAVLAAPAGASISLLATRLRIEAWLVRSRFPGLPWEDVLRDRGEVLYRWAYERIALDAAVPP